jgi:hypothetical protein
VARILYGLMQAVALPGVLLIVVASRKPRSWHAFSALACLLLLTGLNLYPFFSRLGSGAVPRSAYWLGFGAPSFPLIAVAVAVAVLGRKLRTEKTGRNERLAER